MENDLIARRYSEALFKIALENKNVDEIYRDLGSFLTACSLMQCAEEFLLRSYIAKKERISVIKIMGEALSFKPDTVNFLSLLIENSRINCFYKIFLEYSRLRNEAAGIMRAEVVSASKLTMGEMDRLKAELEKNKGKTFIIREKVDKGILGGFITSIEDKVYDLSIKTALSRLQNELKREAQNYGG